MFLLSFFNCEPSQKCIKSPVGRMFSETLPVVFLQIKNESVVRTIGGRAALRTVCSTVTCCKRTTKIVDMQFLLQIGLGVSLPFEPVTHSVQERVHYHKEWLDLQLVKTGLENPFDKDEQLQFLKHY